MFEGVHDVQCVDMDNGKYRCRVFEEHPAHGDGTVVTVDAVLISDSEITRFDIDGEKEFQLNPEETNCRITEPDYRPGQEMLSCHPW